MWADDSRKQPRRPGESEGKSKRAPKVETERNKTTPEVKPTAKPTEEASQPENRSRWNWRRRSTQDKAEPEQAAVPESKVEPVKPAATAEPLKRRRLDRSQRSNQTSEPPRSTRVEPIATRKPASEVPATSAPANGEIPPATKQRLADAAARSQRPARAPSAPGIYEASAEAGLMGEDWSPPSAPKEKPSRQHRHDPASAEAAAFAEDWSPSTPARQRGSTMSDTGPGVDTSASTSTERAMHAEIAERAAASMAHHSGKLSEERSYANQYGSVQGDPLQAGGSTAAHEAGNTAQVVTNRGQIVAHHRERSAG